MITFQRETLFDVVEEVEPLLQMHYEELCLHREHIELAPRWDVYRALECVDAFRVFTARDDGKLVGYSAFFVNQHMHYERLTIAGNDVLFLHPDYRKGRIGYKLITFSIDQLQQLKTSDAHKVKIVWRSKYDDHDTKHDFRPLLYRLGYTDEESSVSHIY